MDDDWENFLESGDIKRENTEFNKKNPKYLISISIKTKIVYLNNKIDLDSLFLNIDIRFHMMMNQLE